MSGFRNNKKMLLNIFYFFTVLQLLVLQPSVKKPTQEESASLWTLIKDPYIMVAAGKNENLTSLF